MRACSYHPVWHGHSCAHTSCAAAAATAAPPACACMLSRCAARWSRRRRWAGAASRGALPAATAAAARVSAPAAATMGRVRRSQELSVCDVGAAEAARQRLAVDHSRGSSQAPMQLAIGGRRHQRLWVMTGCATLLPQPTPQRQQCGAAHPVVRAVVFAVWRAASSGGACLCVNAKHVRSAEQTAYACCPSKCQRGVALPVRNVSTLVTAARTQVLIYTPMRAAACLTQSQAAQVSKHRQHAIPDASTTQ